MEETIYLTLKGKLREDFHKVRKGKDAIAFLEEIVKDSITAALTAQKAKSTPKKSTTSKKSKEKLT